MEALTISQVSKDFGVSTRMLRYYEQMGLLQSFRREDYAYRMYDEAALYCLRQVLILRKLRIPVKKIKLILKNPNATSAIDIFRQNIRELDEEIAALSTIKDILSRFVDELQKTADIRLPRLMTYDGVLLASIESLPLTSINFKEDRTMYKLKKAEESLLKLSDVRIIYLPPGAVAAAHHIEDDPEEHTGRMIDEFVRDTGLCKVKPDLRHFGFNNPNPVNETDTHGYEMWVTIPDNMDVPPPLTKKHFTGGLYAAHMIAMGNFNEWGQLYEWVMKSEKYEYAGDTKDQEHMCGCLEEHLNYIGHAALDYTEPEDMQLDLLIPIKERSK